MVKFKSQNLSHRFWSGAAWVGTQWGHSLIYFRRTLTFRSQDAIMHMRRWYKILKFPTLGGHVPPCPPTHYASDSDQVLKKMEAIRTALSHTRENDFYEIFHEMRSIWWMFSWFSKLRIWSIATFHTPSLSLLVLSNSVPPYRHTCIVCLFVYHLNLFS